MLYSENRQSGEKDCYPLTVILILVLVFLSSCSDSNRSVDRIISVEAFSDLKTPEFVLSLQYIDSKIDALSKSDKAETAADRMAQSYYRKKHRKLVWVSRYGVNECADSLLQLLHMVNEIGMSERAFMVGDIERDIHRMRMLDYDEKDNQASCVAARLEYNLTKACFRYCLGQRYGFVNPHRLYNNLDIEKQDSVNQIVRYRGLFDVKMDLPSQHVADSILQLVSTDRLGEFLREIQPADFYYLKLKSLLPDANNTEQRKRILVNMERARWRRQQPIGDAKKYIVVNIPAYHLYAYCPDSMLDMRVVCGSMKTKTPQLSSYVEWMEVNPQWVIPFSIIENDVSLHAGDTAYFSRNHYKIYEKNTNRQIPIHYVSRQMLLTGKYRVAQEGGSGNSLGRIIFRFKNNYSVFLHDTSNPGAFNRESRAISHGCVRLSKPFELACFLLDNPNEWLLDCIRISMGISPATERGMEYISQHQDTEHHKLINYVPVKPRVPLFIIYNTLWPDADGVLQPWPDVYGFDQAMWEELRVYTL